MAPNKQGPCFFFFSFSFFVLQKCGSVLAWHWVLLFSYIQLLHGPLVPWSCVPLWSSGSVVLWSCGPFIWWSCGLLALCMPERTNVVQPSYAFKWDRGGPARPLELRTYLQPRFCASNSSTWSLWSAGQHGPSSHNLFANAKGFAPRNPPLLKALRFYRA